MLDFSSTKNSKGIGLKSIPSSPFFSRPLRPFKTITGDNSQNRETIQMCPKCKNPKCKKGELCQISYGTKSRQKKRKEQIQSINKTLKKQKSWKNRTDFLIDERGNVFKPIHGAGTGLFFQTSRGIHQNFPTPKSDTLTMDTSSLKSMSSGVMNISKRFIEKPNTPFKVKTSSNQTLGRIQKSNAPWFRKPKWSSFNPSLSSAFAIPLDKNQKKQKSIYGKNEGIFSKQSTSKDSSLSLGRRLLVSGSESVRGIGSGLGQVMAMDLFKGPNKPTRNTLYGTGKNPGLIPTTYSGSQVDIALTEEESLSNNWEKTQRNPVGIQTENILGMMRYRKNKKSKLKRSLSNPDLTAPLKLHQKETNNLMTEMGLIPKTSTRKRKAPPLPLTELETSSPFAYQVKRNHSFFQNRNIHLLPKIEPFKPKKKVSKKHRHQKKRKPPRKKYHKKK